MSLAQAHKFYINDVQLPQTPSKITISNQDKTEVFTNANGRPVTIPKPDGPQTYEFEFEITHQAYPFTFSEVLKNFKYYTDLLWNIKNNQEPCTLTITRYNGIHYKENVLLTDYNWVEDSANDNDVTISVKFINFWEWGNQELQEGIGHHLIRVKNARGWIGPVDTELISEEERIEKAKREAQNNSSTSSTNTDDSAQKLLNVANGHIGYTTTETDSAFGRLYVGPNAGNWCAYFVRACAESAGLPFPATGYCPDVVTWAQSEGRWTNEAKTGYYVLFDFNSNGTADHIGIVENVNDDGTIVTIEGNTSGATGTGVWRKTRGSNILGYVNPF